MTNLKNTARKFQFVEPDDSGNDLTITISEDTIRKEYWPWWQGEMLHRGVAEHKITFESCLEHFCEVHWAVEL